jgi:hypothetical protein
MTNSDSGFWGTVQRGPKALLVFVVVLIAIALAISMLTKAAGGRWPWERSRVDPSPAPSPEPAPKPSPQPVEQKVVAPKYLERDPITNQPYETYAQFKVGDHIDPNRNEGGDSNAPGHPWSFSWTAPGPVAEVHMDANPGWEGEHPCTRSGNVATCTGWINGGNPTRSMYVRWVQKADDTAQ